MPQMPKTVNDAVIRQIVKLRYEKKTNREIGNLTGLGEAKIQRIVHRLIQSKMLPKGIPGARKKITPLEELFDQLASQWERETRNMSSPQAMTKLPAYQQIIAMGKPALPLILRRMRKLPGFWFAALREISGVQEDPIKPSMYGNLQAMTDVWLKWGKRNGYLSIREKRMPQTEIVQYIRRSRRGTNALVGVMVARKVVKPAAKNRKVTKSTGKDQLVVGWSKCNVGKDRFDKTLGLHIARSRIEKAIAEGAQPTRNERQHHPIPDSIQDDLKQFQERAAHYFRTKPQSVELA
jgi:hypothetical protein